MQQGVRGEEKGAHAAWAEHTWGGTGSCGRPPPRRARAQSARSESRAARPAGACSSTSSRGATPSAAAAREGPHRRSRAAVARRWPSPPRAQAAAPKPEASDRRAPPLMRTHRTAQATGKPALRQQHLCALVAPPEAAWHCGAAPQHARCRAAIRLRLRLRPHPPHKDQLPLRRKLPPLSLRLLPQNRPLCALGVVVLEPRAATVEVQCERRHQLCRRRRRVLVLCRLRGGADEAHEHLLRARVRVRVRVRIRVRDRVRVRVRVRVMVRVRDARAPRRPSAAAPPALGART